jgi:hypothetical protein
LGGPPYLVALTVSGTGIALQPSFSPDTYDYFVGCAEGSNALTVSMVASAGATSALVQPAPSSFASEQTLPVTVTANEAIVAVATDGKTTTEYWVRCLPSDFPPLQWSPHPEAGVPSPGYYLVGTIVTPSPDAGGVAMILDRNGVPVWYWRAPPGFGASTVDSPSRGVVFYDPLYPTTPEPFQVRQLSPLETTEAGANGFVTDEHELVFLKNGDYLALSYPYKYGVDLTGLTLPTRDGGIPLGPNSTLQDCAIVEFTPSGSVVWTWYASDHFNPVADSTHVMGYVGPPPPDGGAAYDLFHCNSIDVDPTNGNLLVSSREMSSVFYVERSSGKVLWKMGGAQASLDNATYVAVDDLFLLQHDARLQPGWSADCNGGTGQVSVFDDQTNRPGAGTSRGILYDVVVGSGDAGLTPCDGGSLPDGAAPGTARRAWEYRGASPSAGVGSFRINADGSRIIGWGLGGNMVGQVNGVFTELDVDGGDLLDFAFGTSGNPSYRAVKKPLDAFDLEVLRKTSGLP